jgi:hypothetical protein
MSPHSPPTPAPLATPLAFLWGSDDVFDGTNIDAPSSIVVNSGTAYVGVSNGLAALDVSDVAAMVHLSTYTILEGITYYGVVGVALYPADPSVTTTGIIATAASGAIKNIDVSALPSGSMALNGDYVPSGSGIYPGKLINFDTDGTAANNLIVALEELPPAYTTPILITVQSFSYTFSSFQGGLYSDGTYLGGTTAQDITMYGQGSRWTNARGRSRLT